MQVQFKKPNRKREWCEAVRYGDVFKNRKEWYKVISAGEEIDASGLAGVINNTDYGISLTSMIEAYEKEITEDRKSRVEKMFKEGVIELPVVMLYKEQYELIGGNTRLTKMGILKHQCGFPVRVFLIRV